jgi:alpha-beta hydrolase superfamily lysophospholipase
LIRNKRKIKPWLITIIVLYILGGVVLYFVQERIIFHPVKLPASYHFTFKEPFREIDLRVTPDKRTSIVQFTVPDSVCKGVVLYFHGNMENITHYEACVTTFTRNDWEVWMIDYPGFGKSTGKRTENILYDDAQEFYKMAAARFPATEIIIYGRSIGTGIACKLASIRGCKRLILETPYYSMDALARHYFLIYPVMPMTKYAFPSNLFLKNVQAPVTIFHGSHDEIIPYRQSKNLMKIIPHGELITIANGEHNNLAGFQEYQQKMDSLLR